MSNPGALAPGIYATIVTVNSANGAGPVSASHTYCLTVGTWISVGITTPNDPTDTAPLYIEAGTSRNQANGHQSFLTVSAFGATNANDFKPTSVNVPFAISPTTTAQTPAVVTLDSPGGGCAGGLVTPATYCLDTAPPLLTPAMEYDPAYLVTACGLTPAALTACATNGTGALVVPALPSSTPPPTTPGVPSATFVFRVEVTSGVTLQYFTDFSLYSNSATYPPGGGAIPPGSSDGNLVTGAQLLTEPGGPFSVEPVDSIGTGAPDFPVGTTPYGPGVLPPVLHGPEHG